MMYFTESCMLFHGDWKDALVEVNGAFDAILSDPPYGIKFVKGNTGSGPPRARSTKGKRSTKMIIGDDTPFDPKQLLDLSDNVMLFGADHYSQRLPETGRWLVWDKLAGMTSFDSFSDVEFIWHSKKGASRICSLKWKGIAREKKEDGSARLHPFQKPIRLMRWCLEQLNPANCVFDPFMGSGTTGVACVQKGLHFIGAEVDEDYFNTAMKRIQKEEESSR
jgi:site-specific DNA-methyltransferase (adenine-specific)/modification methylase